MSLRLLVSGSFNEQGGALWISSIWAEEWFVFLRGTSVKEDSLFQKLGGVP